jgi:beta-galactosidase/beta-glucuronidase
MMTKPIMITKPIPRPEYPRPQFFRNEWLNLNGEWQFEIDYGDSGLERGLTTRDLTGHILVPFCPESKLSGIENTDFLPAVWYRREVSVPRDWNSKNILIHFQAVDYDATVWVNGREVGRHRGGFTPFTCDLSGLIQPGGSFSLVVRARDPRFGPMPRGKQAREYNNSGCLYTRTTGIWQTVWIEPVPDVYFLRPRLTPDLTQHCFHLEIPLNANSEGYFIRATLADGRGKTERGLITQVEIPAGTDRTPLIDLTIPARRVRLWQPGGAHLYVITLTLFDSAGKVVDQVTSYAGLRSVTVDGNRILINGKPVFQRLVLDQGFYPDGILTAPSDEALENDIKLSMAAGFNGARLHQKVFEERYLYHADRLGYLVWGEFPDWGSQGFGPTHDHQRLPATYIAQWLEAIQRDYSHPSIVGWCPLNETWQSLTDNLTDLDDGMRALFLATKALDLTRPVLDTSGYSHRVPESEVYDSHDYEQNPVNFHRSHSGNAGWKPYENRTSPDGKRAMSLPYQKQPYFVSEFGGIWWNPKEKPEEDSWGYGNRPKNIEEFYKRFESLCNTLLDNPGMFGYCYTQLTDVYQEQNGIYTFDRTPKFDLERLKNIQAKLAAYEAGV